MAERKYNYFYRIINMVNNKFYYGVHKTDNLNDNYMGSGKLIKYAIKKYGIENFRKDYLLFFDTYNDALVHEAFVVNNEILNNELCYNLKLGGSGGSMKGINAGRHHTKETKDKISKRGIGRKVKESTKLKKALLMRGKKQNHKPRIRSEEEKEKRRLAAIGKHNKRKIPMSKEEKEMRSRAMLGKNKCKNKK